MCAAVLKQRVPLQQLVLLSKSSLQELCARKKLPMAGTKLLLAERSACVYGELDLDELRFMMLAAGLIAKGKPEDMAAALSSGHERSQSAVASAPSPSPSAGKKHVVASTTATSTAAEEDHADSSAALAPRAQSSELLEEAQTLLKSASRISKTVGASSLQKSKGSLLRSAAASGDDDAADNACIELGPVKLGDLYHLADGAAVTPSQMLEFIMRDALTWSTKRHASHKLKDFFLTADLKKTGSGGFVLKPGFDVTVDYILPPRLGGIDHPRNLAFMARRLSTGSSEQAKAAMLSRDADTIQRLVRGGGGGGGSIEAVSAAMTAWAKTCKRGAGSTLIALAAVGTGSSSSSSSGGAAGHKEDSDSDDGDDDSSPAVGGAGAAPVSARRAAHRGEVAAKRRK